MSEYVFHILRSLSTTKDLRLIAQFDDGTVKSYDVSKLMKRSKYFTVFEEKPSLFSKSLSICLQTRFGQTERQ